MKPLASVALVSGCSIDGSLITGETSEEAAVGESTQDAGGAPPERRRPLALASLPVLCQQRPARRGIAISRIRQRPQVYSPRPGENHRAAEHTRP
jgi:hypothetical protein